MNIKTILASTVFSLLTCTYANAFEVQSNADFPDEAYRSFSYTIGIEEQINTIGWMITNVQDKIVESRISITNIVLDNSPISIGDLLLSSSGNQDTSRTWGYEVSTGSILELSGLNLNTGETISFDWSFSTDETFQDALNGYQDFSLANIGGNVVELGVVAAVPEMQTWAMLMFGVGLVGHMARRKNTKFKQLA